MLAESPTRQRTTMRAITQDRYGGPETLALDQVEVPKPGAGEVLVEVHAAGVDRGTWHLMRGTPYLIRLGFGLTEPKQRVLGFDVAGRVVARGAEVSRFRVGDEVFGFARGSLAEFALASEEALSLKPAGVSFAEAGVVAVSGSTALQALTEHGQVQAGQEVLIVGASGGVGSHAVQLARALGARVTGVASGPKLERVRALGASEVVDYKTEDFVSRGRRYDLVLDIGGRNSISRLRQVLTPAGTLVVVGGEGSDPWTGGLGRQLWALALSPFLAQSLQVMLSEEHSAWLDRLGDFMSRGDLVPKVGQRYALEDAPAALEDLEAGVGFAKSVIVVRGKV